MKLLATLTIVLTASACSRDASSGSDSSNRSRRPNGGESASSHGTVGEGSSQVKGGITPVNFQLAGVFSPGESKDGPILDESRGLVADCVETTRGAGKSAKSACPSACDVGTVSKVEWTGFWRADVESAEKILCECIMATKSSDLRDALKKAEDDHDTLKKSLDAAVGSGGAGKAETESLAREVEAAAASVKAAEKALGRADLEIAKVIADAKTAIAAASAVSPPSTDSAVDDGLYIGRYRGMRNAIFVRRSRPVIVSGSSDSEP